MESNPFSAIAFVFVFVSIRICNTLQKPWNMIIFLQLYLYLYLLVFVFVLSQSDGCQHNTTNAGILRRSVRSSLHNDLLCSMTKLKEHSRDIC